MSFSDKLLKQFQETLTQFKQDYDKWEKHTLAEYIKKCDELVEAQIEANIINIESSGISAYLYKKLNDFGISVTDRYIQKILPDNHKRNKSTSEHNSLMEDKWENIETEDPTIKLEKNQYNDIKINGIEQRPKDKLKTIQKEKETPIKSKDTREYVYLTALSKLSNKFHLTIETLKTRYNESDEVQEIIDKELGDVEKKLQDYAKSWASIENSKGMIDLRRDWGEYEKIMGAFIIEVGETIARIAQIMDYSEKYGSIGLLREPLVREFFETKEKYPLYLRSCPKCFADICQVMNENIALYRECVNLNIDMPTIKYS